MRLSVRTNNLVRSRRVSDGSSAEIIADVEAAAIGECDGSATEPADPSRTRLWRPPLKGYGIADANICLAQAATFNPDGCCDLDVALVIAAPSLDIDVYHDVRIAPLNAHDNSGH